MDEKNIYRMLDSVGNFNISDVYLIQVNNSDVIFYRIILGIYINDSDECKVVYEDVGHNPFRKEAILDFSSFEEIMKCQILKNDNLDKCLIKTESENRLILYNYFRSTIKSNFFTDISRISRCLFDLYKRSCGHYSYYESYERKLTYSNIVSFCRQCYKIAIDVFDVQSLLKDRYNIPNISEAEDFIPQKWFNFTNGEIDFSKFKEI